VPGLSGGNHTVTFKIAVATDATATSLLAGAEAQAAVGVGSLTAQVVKTLTPFDSITVGPGFDAHAYMRSDGLQPRRWREMDWNYRSPV
ncbi:MAG TPA: hypothetical protein VJ349_09710, partial [Stellaceae bacterium]|nr:hypothetical protein [Stellaceae bacterium]